MRADAVNTRTINIIEAGQARCATEPRDLLRWPRRFSKGRTIAEIQRRTRITGH
jgi:hypothetical protein